MSIYEHFNELNKIICQLTSIGSKLKEEDKALILLFSLPSSYQHLVTRLLCGNDSIDLDEVIVVLSNKMRKMGFVGEVQVKGLVAGGKIKGKRFRSSLEDLESYYFYKKGNTKANCPMLQGMNERKFNSSNAANIMEEK